MKDGRCHVAIIDDGICLSHYAPPLLCYRDFVNTANTEESTTHSYIVAQIIKKYNNECHISNIKVIDEQGNGDVNHLIEAIRWCIVNDIDVIHLSIGSTHFSDFSVIHAAIIEASAKNITIVASQSNDSIFTVPACLDTVIGVRSSDECKPCEFIIRYDNWDGIDIVTSSRFIIVDQFGSLKAIAPSNSFASPYITALVAKIITRYGKTGKSSALAYLEQYAKDIKGKPAQKVRQRPNRLPFEDFSYYNQRISNRMLRVYKNIVTPIILIDDGKLHKMIFNHFISAGYNCYPAIIDVQHIPTARHSLIQENIRRFLSFVDIKYDPDIFIVLSGSDLIPYYDVQIGFREDISIVFRSGRRVQLPKNQINELMQELMQYFS